VGRAAGLVTFGGRLAAAPNSVRAVPLAPVRRRTAEPATRAQGRRTRPSRASRRGSAPCGACGPHGPCRASGGRAPRPRCAGRRCRRNGGAPARRSPSVDEQKSKFIHNGDTETYELSDDQTESIRAENYLRYGIPPETAHESDDDNLLWAEIEADWAMLDAVAEY
jgi:hypothetical protein